MIEIFTGKLGGGKTYNAIRRIREYIANGGIVCTNIELVWPEIEKYCSNFGIKPDPRQYIQLKDEHVDYSEKGRSIKVSQICLFHRYTPPGTKDLPSLIVIDEAPLYLDSRNWNMSPEEMLTFLRQSRKNFTDIIFIAQEFSDIDKKVRVLAQYVWKFLDMRRYSLPLIKVKMPLPLLMVCQWDYSGKMLIKTQMYFIDPSVYRCYNTNQVLREFPRLERINIKQGKAEPEMNKKLLYINTFGLLIAAYFMLQIHKKVKSVPDNRPDIEIINKEVANIKQYLEATNQRSMQHHDAPKKEVKPVAVSYDGIELTTYNPSEDGLSQVKYMLASNVQTPEQTNMTPRQQQIEIGKGRDKIMKKYQEMIKPKN